MRPNLARQIARHLSGQQKPAFLRNSFSDFGFVEIRGSGVWSVCYLDAHFADLAQRLVTVRQQYGLARVLVNLSDAAEQPPDVAARIGFWTRTIYTAADRVAVLVDSDTVREQMKQRVMIATFDVFISEVAARLWLYER